MSNSYNVTEDLELESTGRNFIDVGIHENVELTKIEYKSTNEGNQFIAFYFKDEQGRELSHTEWEPKDDDVEKLASKTKNVMRRIGHIAVRFITKDEFYTIKADNFKEFALAVIAKLEGKYQGAKLRIKAIYNYNNYVTLPRYLPFIENMSTTKEDSKLEIITIDKVKRDLPDSEIPVENPFAEKEGTTDTNQEDLPF